MDSSSLMIEDALAPVFNRILDCTAVFSVPVYSFSFYVIFKHTPPNITNFTRLLLNILLWNALGNLICAFGHPYPMFPVICFRIDGLLASFESELLGHVLFGSVLLVVTNVGFGIFLSFHFRFMVIARRRRISKTSPKWGYAYCTAVHVFSSAVYMVLYYYWTIPVADYPHQDQLPSRSGLICFHPDGIRMTLIVAVYIAFILFIVVSISAFLLLSFHSLHKNTHSVSHRTVQTQKLLLINLIILTAIPILAAGIPFFVVAICIYLSWWRYSQLVSSICIGVLVNHGPIMCITTLAMFRSYRCAVKNIVLGIIGKHPGVCAVHVLPSSVIGS